ncbi:class I SAM-dependent methyltransferase [Bernardetia sp.]|uniref:class I SAM-dependent methyltransferase n=1 Tax=Bernardetia sp. TaxID=1937974 RepID=UPI0025BF2666|nr:methyltransferase domain-containing protein [Bernardetia sp.]
MSEYKDYGYQIANNDHTEGYLVDNILSLLDKNKNKLILDVGCGNGWLTAILIQNGFNVYGTDASESGIKIANQRKESNEKQRFFVQDLSKDTLPNEISVLKFDTIISTEVIEHLYDPRKYISFCKQVLQQNGGGQILITTPYHGYLKNVLLSITGKMDAHFTALWDGGHIKFWSKKTLTQLLEENDFKVTDFVGCGRLPYLWKSMLIKAKI